MNDSIFTSLYETWPTDKLLDVLDNPSEYQPIALDTARAEIARRNLTEQQLDEARADQLVRRLVAEEVGTRKVSQQEKVMKAGRFVVDWLSPVDVASRPARWYIQIVALLVGGNGLYLLYQKSNTIRAIFAGEVRLDYWWIWAGPIDIVLFITMAVLFWLRRKTGWILLAGSASLKAASTITSFVRDLNTEPVQAFGFELFPDVPLETYLFNLLLSGSLVATLCQEQIRTVYNVSKRTMYIVISVGVVVAIALSLIPMLVTMSLS